MSGRVVSVIILGAFLFSVSTAFAEPNLVGWWKFDEGIGDTAGDSSGNGNDGTLVNGPVWTGGQIEGALDFDGSNDYVSVPDDNSLNISGAITVCAWFKLDVKTFNRAIVGKVASGGDSSGGGYRMIFYKNTIYSDGTFRLVFQKADGTHGTASGNYGDDTNWDRVVSEKNDWETGVWYHVTGVWDGTTDPNGLRIYIDGVQNAGHTANQGIIKLNNSALQIGRTLYTSPLYQFNGVIDDVRIYERALSAGEIEQIYLDGLVMAYNLSPAYGALGIDPNVVLSWHSGKDAASHDVYFGIDYNDVNDADTFSDEYMGNFDVNYWDPCGLEPTTKYYWRIDEVNDSNLWRGYVWNFETVRPEIWLSKRQFQFLAMEGDADPNDQILGISNNGAGILNWTASCDCNWLSAEPNSGSSTGEVDDVNLSIDISGLNWGFHDCSLSIWDSNATNSPRTVGVTLRVFMEDGMDFGDAPEAGTNYPTTLARDGARHTIDPDVYLGSDIDEEIDGQPSALADGDDNNYLPDEDGVSFVSPGKPGLSYDIEVEASTNGFLDAWIDFNADGDWSDANEQIFDDEPLSAGINQLTFNVPLDANDGNTYARFRFSSGGGMEPYGLAPDGEVEDYRINILADDECMAVTNPDYDNWVYWEKPDCWCYARQCRGDVDGLKFANVFWVSGMDLYLLKMAISKPEPMMPEDGECADFDHEKFANIFWISGNDLAILRQYITKLEIFIPECGNPPDPNYNFWLTP